MSPRTGPRVAPPASTLGRLPEMIDPDGSEAALTACVAEAALDPAVPAAHAAHRAEQQRRKGENRKSRRRRPPAARSFREERGDGWFRPHTADAAGSAHQHDIRTNPMAGYRDPS